MRRVVAGYVMRYAPGASWGAVGVAISMVMQRIALGCWLLALRKIINEVNEKSKP